MSRPSFQASNAIIYITYATFLSVRPHILPHTTNMLTVSAQGVGPLFCVVQERTVKISVLSHDPYTEMSGLAHFGLSSERRSPTKRLHVRRTRANHYLAIPLALNFIASCECT